MSEEFVRINIAFMPPVEIAEKVAQISYEIGAKEESYFVIDRKNFHPHITIYGFEFPARNLENVLAEIEILSKKLSSAKFVFKKVTTEEGYIGIECDNTEEIKHIHETTIKALNPWREGHIRDKDKNMKSSEKNLNVQEYGHPRVMDSYCPHMTIIRLKDDEVAEKIATEIQWTDNAFVLDRIGAFRMGPNGTCVELIREFKLG
ncbi:MAG: 2'-5' RNA ligase family protein [Candidatus Moranbacteria bacterium]|nr:2'-5' RNA ligase family protein [Candidatus Moranbacteria bacterium]